MPLALPALQNGIQSVAANPPATVAQCAQAWADAVQSYAAGVVPASTTVAAAAATLSGALASAFSSPAAAPAMDAAFAAFGATVGVGMAAAGFAAVPPAAPVGFGPQFAGPKPETHAEAAQQIAALIDTWMKTGSATLVAPPNTVLTWL
jgi:hypothetical protein